MSCGSYIRRSTRSRCWCSSPGLFALSLAVLQSILLSGSLSATRIAAVWLASFATIACGRMVARAMAGRISPLERCLVIGEVAQARRIRDKLASSPARAEVVASLPLASEEVTAADWVAVPKIMRDVVSELNVHRIIIAPTTTDTRHVVDLIRVSKSVGVRVSVLPRMFEVVGSAVEFDDVDGMTMLGIRKFGLSRSSRALKRTFDLAVGSIVLLSLEPPLPGHRIGNPGRFQRLDLFRSGPRRTRGEALPDPEISIDGGRRRCAQR